MNLAVYGGAKALQEVKSNGLSPLRIRLIIGASGGPKWLALSRLDQYLAEHFMPLAKQPIALLGSSIGSWRMSCYAQKDPLSTLKEFENIYLNQRYGKEIKAQDITDYAHKVLNQLFSEDRAHHVVNNPLRHLNIVAVRNRKLVNGRSKLTQGTTLLTAAALNLLSAKALHFIYPRVVISQQQSINPYLINPATIQLTQSNLKQALLASGAIPMVLEPAKVHGSKDRYHWDGGIQDYHFAGPFNANDGLVFYPHFFPEIIPGWFDKRLPWRKAKAKNYDNVVMVCPSESFIEKLPYGKIPDRFDFEKLTDNEREEYWNKTLDQTKYLVDDFHEQWTKDGFRSIIRPISEVL